VGMIYCLKFRFEIGLAAFLIPCCSSAAYDHEPLKLNDRRVFRHVVQYTMIVV